MGGTRRKCASQCTSCPHPDNRHTPTPEKCYTDDRAGTGRNITIRNRWVACIASTRGKAQFLPPSVSTAQLPKEKAERSAGQTSACLSGSSPAAASSVYLSGSSPVGQAFGVPLPISLVAFSTLPASLMVFSSVVFSCVPFSGVKWIFKAENFCIPKNFALRRATPCYASDKTMKKGRASENCTSCHSLAPSTDGALDADYI